MTAPIEVFRMATLAPAACRQAASCTAWFSRRRRSFWASCCSAASKKPLWTLCKEGRRCKTTEKRPVIEVTGLKKQYKLGQIGGPAR